MPAISGRQMRGCARAGFFLSFRYRVFRAGRPDQEGMIMIAGGSPGAPSSILGESGISWGWLLALGLLMTLLGLVGLGMTYWLTVVAVFWCGVLAIVGGIAQILDAFHHKSWKGIVWHVIIGLIYVAAGLAMVTMPVASALWLTLFLAVSLVVVGFVRIVMAFQIRGQGPVWIAVLLSGVISVAWRDGVRNSRAARSGRTGDIRGPVGLGSLLGVGHRSVRGD